MKNLIITLSLCFFTICTISAQQIGYASQMNETMSFWNPAATAPTTLVNTDFFFRQQWAGFSGAPRTAYAAIQYPFVDYNMSAGAFLFNDKTGPVGRTGIKLNYAYKLREFLTNEGLLSFGLSATLQQFAYNGSGQVFNENDDPLILNGSNSTFFPSFGAGLYFNTHPIDYDRGQNSFYFGLAYNHAYTTNVLLNDANFARERHMYLLIGGKFMSYESFIEPSFTANYVNPEIIDYMMSLKYEKEDAFWAGVGYSSVSDASLQGGVILDRFLDNRYAKLRAGALANYGNSDLGPGFELFIRYEVDID